ncbi:hypothetical protein Tco_1166135 [Tanacetum coccineum]
MVETMEQYMSKTRADYGSEVARPKIEDKDNLELKGQFLKELRTNTFSGSDHEDVNEHIEKVLEIVDLFPYTKNYNRPSECLKHSIPMSLTEPGKPLAKKRTNCKNPKKLTTRNLVDLFKDGDIEQQLLDSIKGTINLSFDGCYHSKPRSKVLQERGFRSLPSSTEANSRDQVKSISTTIEADSYPIRRIGSSQYAVSTRQNCTLMYETRQTTILFPSRLNDMPEDIKVLLILRRPFLSTARAKIDVNKRKITLRVDEERIVFTSVKPATGLRRNQGDDLIPTIEEGEVIKEFKTMDDELDAGINNYPSYCDYDKKIGTITKKRTKTKPKRQNRTSNGKDCRKKPKPNRSRKVNTSKVLQKSQLVKAQVNPEAKKSTNQEI